MRSYCSGDIKWVYYTYKQSLLAFGMKVWGGIFSTNFQPLFILRRFNHIVFNNHISDTSENLFSPLPIGVRQLFINSFYSYSIYNNLNSMLVNDHHNTRYAQNIVSSQTFYPVIFEHNFQSPNIHFFDNTSLTTFKKHITD
jgi:hypothetical protein